MLRRHSMPIRRSTPVALALAHRPVPRSSPAAPVAVSPSAAPIDQPGSRPIGGRASLSQPGRLPGHAHRRRGHGRRDRRPSPRRIVSLTPATTEILFALGAGDRVVATDDGSDYPRGGSRAARRRDVLERRRREDRRPSSPTSSSPAASASRRPMPSPSCASSTSRSSSSTPRRSTASTTTSS